MFMVVLSEVDLDNNETETSLFYSNDLYAFPLVKNGYRLSPNDDK